MSKFLYLVDPLHTRQTLLFQIRDTSNDQAWNEFVELYTPLIFRYCASRDVSQSDIPDVTQEVMRSVARAIKNFDYDPLKGRFRSWLFKVTYSKLASHFEKANRQPRGTGSPTIMQRLAEEPSPEAETDWNLQYKRQMFDWAVSKVRPEFNDRIWDAFWKTAVDERPGNEVAEILEMTPGAVYVAKSRVIARLRACIESVSGDFDAPPQIA